MKKKLFTPEQKKAVMEADQYCRTIALYLFDKGLDPFKFFQDFSDCIDKRKEEFIKEQSKAIKKF